MIPWYVVITVGVGGLLALLCGFAVHQVDGEGGDRRILAGLGAVGAAFLVAVGKSAFLIGQSWGWW